MRSLAPNGFETNTTSVSTMLHPRLICVLVILNGLGGTARGEVDVDSFPVEKLDFPIASGPFEPTWESIEANHPGTPEWFRDAKFGVWIHWGPQAAGRSGDWYAKHLYLEDHRAAANHRRNFGHPSVFGYKDVLHQWQIPDFNPAALMESFHDAGFRYAVIMGVHHDNFDLWNSQHQPWNSTRVGPKRDIVGEWARAARKQGIRFGVSFHHEYTWWWWQPAFGADAKGPLAGVSYDGNLTAADGKGKWWDGLDPRDLYGMPLEGYPEYEPVHLIAHGRQGIFYKHLDYARAHATRWAKRIIDVVDHYDPDFIYTDGNSPQPFSGKRSGSGYKCDAAQRVVAHYYNRTLERHGQVDTFSIVKFSPPRRGLASTAESRIPQGTNTAGTWMGELAIGGWFYEPGYYYDAGMVVRALLEFAARDGNFAVSVPLTPSGALEPGAPEMLAEIGRWMRVNGEGIYGSKAWERAREGERTLPRGALNKEKADFEFTTDDLRFTVGKDGALYVWCMAVPESGSTLRVHSLGRAAGLVDGEPTSVTLLGSDAAIEWTVTDEALELVCPDTAELRYAVGFRVTY
jgi:alpha-L-fucosidase